jgi:AMP phosphorylase
MKLKAKWIDFSSGGPLVGVLHQHDAITLNIRSLDRIKLCFGNKQIVVTTDITHDKKQVKPGEIGLFKDLKKHTKVKKGQQISVKYAKEPSSVDLIKKKLDGKELNREEINKIVKDLISNSLTEVESTYFVSACYMRKMSLNETKYLTEAIIKNSGKLHFKKHPIADKHCIGGVAGNRTTMVVVPILAAAGVTIPKTSTKSITSPAGTSNTMEILAPISFSNKEIINIVNKTNACMVWGGQGELASADDKLIKIERPLHLDARGFLLSSILAKKTAADASHVLIDIPIGPEAKIKNKAMAKDLREKFLKLGRMFKLKINVILSDGTQPIGNGIGPALEARDVLLALKGEGPKDLQEKSFAMAALLMKMVGISKAEKKVKQIILSGLAHKKMMEIIKAQGGNPNITPEKIKLAPHTSIIKAPKAGRVRYLSNREITRIAKLCGAPTHLKAGLYIHKKVGEIISQGEPMITLHAEDKSRLQDAIKEAKNSIIFNIA